LAFSTRYRSDALISPKSSGVENLSAIDRPGFRLPLKRSLIREATVTRGNGGAVPANRKALGALTRGPVSGRYRPDLTHGARDLQAIGHAYPVSVRLVLIVAFGQVGKLFNH
jgi:hypothetical protein